MSDASIPATPEAVAAPAVAPGPPPAVAPTVEPVIPAPESNPWEDPKAAQAEIEKLRKENGAARTQAKQQAADEARQSLAQQIGKALGLVKDDEPADPAKLTEQLTATQAQAKQAALELAVFKAASASKADAAALLDSRSFLEQVATIDPTDTAALTAAISEATTSNPRLRVSQAATVGGAEISGGTGGARTYTREQLRDTAFYTANQPDILRALSEGRIRE